jgi:hypothetical protein
MVKGEGVKGKGAEGFGVRSEELEVPDHPTPWRVKR